MLMFLISLAIAAISACIFANSSQITAELTGTATVLSLGISLVYAPWQVKLLLLLVLLITTQPLLRPRTQEPAPMPEPEEQPRQKVFQYRGVSYQPTTEAVDAAMPNRESATPATASPNLRLQYRGVSVPARSPNRT